MRADQVYFTHCRREDSFNQHTGYSIRATSVRDGDLLRFVTDHGSYELPLGLTAPTQKTPGGVGYRLPEEAPQRLARVKTPDRGIALIHTSHLEFDTSQPPRPNSFFTHALIVSKLSALDALRTWGAKDWTRKCRPGESKELSQRPLPQSGVLDDKVLTAFLTDPRPLADQNLATVTIPRRLDNCDKRRELLCLFMQGLDRVLAAKPPDGRNRLFVLAEPGLVALLLYGALRLMPPRLAEDVTFSTYESSLHALRESAQVVATYVPPGGAGLGADFLRARGFGLDTFRAEASDDLEPKGTASVNRLLTLAAEGKYDRIDQVYARCNTLNGFAEAERLLDRDERMPRGELTVKEVEKLIETEDGRRTLAPHEEANWAVIREGSLTSEKLLHAFPELHLRHLDELKKLAAAKLAAPKRTPQAEDDWKLHSARLAWLVKDRPAVLLDLLALATPTALCAEAVIECFAPGGPDDKANKIEPLLEKLTDSDLERLNGAGLPADAMARVLHLGLFRPETVEVAGRLARAAGDPVYLALCEGIAGSKHPQQTVALRQLVMGKEASNHLQRLLKTPPNYHPRALHKLLQDLGAYDRDWLRWWLGEGRLGSLLRRAVGEHGEPIWAAFTPMLDKALLVEDDKDQSDLLEQLKAAGKVVGESIPPRAAQAVNDWLTLSRHFDNPDGTPKGSHQKLQKACKQWKGLLSEYFLRRLHERNAPDAEVDRFAKVCLGFQAQEDQGREATDERFLTWLEIVEGCQEHKRIEQCVRVYAMKHMPPQWRKPLLIRNKDRCPGIENLNVEEPEMSIKKAVTLIVVCALLFGVVTGLVGTLMGASLAEKSTPKTAEPDKVGKDVDTAIKTALFAERREAEKRRVARADARIKKGDVPDFEDLRKKQNPQVKAAKDLTAEIDATNNLDGVEKEVDAFENLVQTFVTQRMKKDSDEIVLVLMERRKAAKQRLESAYRWVEYDDKFKYKTGYSELLKAISNAKVDPKGVEKAEQDAREYENAVFTYKEKPVQPPDTAAVEARIEAMRKQLERNYGWVKGKEEETFDKFREERIPKAKDYAKLSEDVKKAEKARDEKAVAAVEKEVQRYEDAAIAFLKVQRDDKEKPDPKSPKDRFEVMKQRLEAAKKTIKAEEEPFRTFRIRNFTKAKDYEQLSKEIAKADPEKAEALEKDVFEFERVVLAYGKAKCPEGVAELIVRPLEQLRQLVSEKEMKALIALTGKTGKLKEALQDPTLLEDAKKLVDALNGFIIKNWPIEDNIKRGSTRKDFKALLEQQKDAWEKIGAKKEFNNLLDVWR